MEFIRTAVAAGNNATIGAPGATVLRNGRSFRQLVTPGGKRTAAGRQFEEETGTVLELAPYATAQVPRRENDTEWIKMRGGDERIVRRFDSAAQRWKYTQLGREYFKTQRTQWVVRVPSQYAGTRANGLPYTRNGWHLVSENISLPTAWSEAQRDRKIRRTITDMFPTGVLAEFSGERRLVHSNCMRGRVESVRCRGRRPNNSGDLSDL